MTSDKPLVSILTTSYNYGQYIGQAIQSVLDQTYDRWELIISDDASTDNSLEVIRSFDDPRITVITSEKNEGGPANRAKAYALCRGRYLTTLNSDDFIAPDKLEKQVRYLEEHPEVDILGTFVSEVDSGGQRVGDHHPHEAWFNCERDMNQPSSWLWENHLCHSSVLMRKSVHDRIGPFNNDLKYLGDYEFWVRCLIAGAVFHVLKEKLTYYRFHGSNITGRDPERAFLEHVYVFCTHLKPYLLKLNQYDLVSESIATFLSHHESYPKADDNLKANVIATLLAAENPRQAGRLFLESIHTPATLNARIAGKSIDSIILKYHQQREQTAELAKANAWRETQIRYWQQMTEEREAQRQDWQRLTEEREAQRQDWQRMAEEREAQRQDWQRLAEEREARLRRMDEYLTRLHLKPLIRLSKRLGLISSQGEHAEPT